MSAFLVDDQTISVITNFLVREVPVHRLPPLMAMAANLDDPYQTIGEMLREMNLQALRERYSGEQGGLPYRYQAGARRSRVGTYKAIQCLLYQCAEGDVPSTPTYQGLDKIAYWLANMIVSRLPEYELEKWG
jgi:hypothetical protein